MLLTDLIVDRLSELGVTHVFAVGGGAILPLHAAVHRKFAVINAAHESGAAFMADAYSRVTGKLGVCLTTSGPGATNALTAIANANADFIPVLLITGQVSTNSFGLHAFQESTEYGIDTVGLFSHACKLSSAVENLAESSTVIDDVLRAALSVPTGPVHLSLPHNLSCQRLPRPVGPLRGLSESLSDGSVEALARARRAIADACSLAVLVGYGTVRAGAFTEVAEFSSRTGAAIYTTPKAKGVAAASNPGYRGVFGFPASEGAVDSLLEGDYDVLIVLGSRLGEWSSFFWDQRLWRGRTVIWIDAVERQVGITGEHCIFVQGDIRAILRQLIRLLDQEGGISESPPVRRRLSPPYLSERQLRIKVESSKLKEGAMHPLSVIEGLNLKCPEETLFFVDIGNSMLWVIPYLDICTPGSFHVNLGLGSMGYATAAVVGAKLVNPDRPVVAVVGDGAFLMNGAEIHTAVIYGCAAVWVVLNDAGFGMLEHVERALAGRALTNSSFSQPVDIAAIARGYGADSVIVRNREEFDQALGAALRSEVPFVIDARIDKTVMAPQLRHRAQHLTNLRVEGDGELAFVGVAD